MRPDRGCSPKGRQGFKDLRDLQLTQHKADPTSTWLKVVDTDIGDKVVGGANWNTFSENPYPRPVDHPMEATWWPEGEASTNGKYTTVLMGSQVNQENSPISCSTTGCSIDQER